MARKNLYLFSAGYPYGKGEVFLGNELHILASEFDQIYIFPSKAIGAHRSIPANCKIVTLGRGFRPISLILGNLFLVIEVLFGELFNTNNRIYFLKNIRHQLSSLLIAIHNANELKNVIDRNTDNYFYSYWMNSWALTCAVLKSKDQINDFVFRVHGFDLYNYNRPGNYIPFRFFNMKNARSVYTVSKEGERYLKSKDIFPEKVECSYLGVYDHGLNPFKKETPITIVTCSSFNINKRILLWIEVLKNVKAQVKWIHFGNGGDLKMEQIMAASSTLPSNIIIEFKGAIPNEDLIKFYSINPVHLFVNVSSTEGLPVTLMEAASFGIPMMATNVGGVAEIVHDESGYLLEKDFDIKYAAKLIDDFYESKQNTIDFRSQVRRMWEENFNAENNYRNFCKKLLNQ